MFEADLAYTVTSYSFTGFFSPINNLPALNDVNAGSSVPIKFSLAGFRGLNLFAPGYPASQAMNCTTRALSGPVRADRIATDHLRDVARSVQERLENAEKLERHVPPADRALQGRHREAR